MKPNWTIILSGFALVASAFFLAFMEGADAAARDAELNTPRIAHSD